MDAEKDAGYDKIEAFINQKKEEWGTEANMLFYMAVAPQLVPDIAKKIADINLPSDSTRIIVEKPFGHDLKSATELNKLLNSMFNEDQIYRIDHYLGKETVQNILALRFANALLEPLRRQRPSAPGPAGRPAAGGSTPGPRSPRRAPRPR